MTKRQDGGRMITWRCTAASAACALVIGAATHVSAGTLAISGFQLSGGIAVTLQLYHIGGPGTYPLGVGPQVPGGAAIVSNTTAGWPGTFTLGPGLAGQSPGMSVGNGQSWASTQTGGSATVSVTSITPTRIRGTFSGTLGPFALSGATGTVTITNGSFDSGRPQERRDHHDVADVLSHAFARDVGA